MKKQVYSNACLMKFKNRRVIVIDLGDDKHLGVKLIKLCETPEEATTPLELVTLTRNKIRTTNMVLSTEAALALYYALGEMITLRNIPKEYVIVDPIEPKEENNL